MTLDLARGIASEMKTHLLQDIMPFWMQRDRDTEYGGYLTCFDREGTLTDANKYIWFQGRQLYVYSLLYNEIEKRQEWLERATWGYRFLEKYAYAGNGRWNFKLSRTGTVLTATNSIYSDYHVAQGLAEYAKATEGTDKHCIDLLIETYAALEKNTCSPSFKDIYENTWSPTFIWNDMYLTALNVANISSKVLGYDRTQALEDECADKIMHWFARDEFQLVFEAISRDNRVVPEGEGRFINPGHSFESAWFLIETGERRAEKKFINRALEIVQWTHRVGWDQERGGIFSYLDCYGQEPVPLDWHRETDSKWDDKVWWVNAEALCAFAKAYVASGGQQEFLEMLQTQWKYCLNYFHDSVFGEWYERLDRDGTVKVADKGTPWKCAFHVSRSLIMAIKALEAIYI